MKKIYITFIALICLFASVLNLNANGNAWNDSYDTWFGSDIKSFTCTYMPNNSNIDFKELRFEGSSSALKVVLTKSDGSSKTQQVYLDKDMFDSNANGIYQTTREWISTTIDYGSFKITYGNNFDVEQLLADLYNLNVCMSNIYLLDKANGNYELSTSMTGSYLVLNTKNESNLLIDLYGDNIYENVINDYGDEEYTEMIEDAVSEMQELLKGHAGYESSQCADMKSRAEYLLSEYRNAKSKITNFDESEYKSVIDEINLFINEDCIVIKNAIDSGLLEDNEFHVAIQEFDKNNVVENMKKIVIIAVIIAIIILGIVKCNESGAANEEQNSKDILY